MKQTLPRCNHSNAAKCSCNLYPVLICKEHDEGVLTTYTTSVTYF